MRRHYLSMTLLALALNAGPLSATEDDSKAIRLICTYSYTINEKGEQSDTSGEELFTVVSLKNGQVAVRKQGLGVPFLGRMSVEEITGEANYEIKNIKFAESLVINRFTGEFQLSFGVVGKGGLIHHGNCRAVTKKLF